MNRPDTKTHGNPNPRRRLTERLLPLFTDKALALTALLLALVFAVRRLVGGGAPSVQEKPEA